MKIYTKTGDYGQTSLLGGTRVSKSHERIDSYGDLDELNSFVGFALSAFPDVWHDEKKLFESIQANLFILGSQLACEVEKREVYKLKNIAADEIQKLENEIDRMTSDLEPLKNFILPGGSEVASRIHLCRTITRRVERKVIAVFDEDSQPANSIIYLNRLSDYFFCFARWANYKTGVADVLWK